MNQKIHRVRFTRIMWQQVFTKLKLIPLHQVNRKIKSIKLLFFSLLSTGLSMCSSIGPKSIDRSATKDLLILKGDSILAVNWYQGLYLTINDGKNWELISDIGINQITIDDNLVWYGISSWEGIHEPGYATIYQSVDFGRNWKIYDYDINNFFPAKIISTPYSKLKVKTQNGNVFELNGDDLLKDWNQLKEITPNGELTVSNDIQINESGLILKKVRNNFFDTITLIKEMYKATGILDIHDTIYVSGYGNDDSAFFAAITNRNNIFRYKMSGKQALGIRKDNKYRIWVYGGEGVFIKENNVLRKVL